MVKVPARTALQNPMLDLVRSAFRDSGLSINELARRGGVPYASVHAIMQGTRDPALSTIQKLSIVLGLELRPLRRCKWKA